MEARHQKPSAKTKILDAALMVIRAKGYAATTVDDLCAASDVTKGAFFHHFKSKDDLAVAAVDHWSEMTGELFEAAPYHAHPDPLTACSATSSSAKQLLTGTVVSSRASSARWCRKPSYSPGNSRGLRRSISDHAEKSRPISPRRWQRTGNSSGMDRK